MPFVTYRRSDLMITGYSGTIADPEHTGEKEIENDVLPYYGGNVEDYAFIEISDEDEKNRRGRQVTIQLVGGEPTFVIGDIIPEPPPEPDRIAQLEQENAALREQLAQTNRDLQDIAEYVFSA